MKEHIDPVTIQKLDEFSSRRKRLLGLRGVCTFLISAIVLFSILATVDLYVLLPDATRAFLTYSAWIIVAAMVWVTCISKLIRKPTRRELAKYIETQEPSLREDLLSAIELGVERSDPKHDSQVFRQLLQNDIASRIKSLDVKSTLPMRLLVRWIQASALLLIFLFGLLLIPDFGKNFSTALGRTMFGANLARVSDISIELLSPDSESVHPEGETIRIKAGLKGSKEDLRLVKKVILETSTPDNVQHRTTMEPDNERNFVARLNMLSADTKFRIQAGLAQSQWFDLNTAPRPKVEHFDITYTPPAYTQLPKQTLSKTRKGDLEGLENTKVQLTLKTNQPIKEGELRLDLATTPANRTIPLQVSDSDPTTLKIGSDDLRLFASGTYRVHLISKDTEFDNKYSPKYEIKVTTDQAPALELVKPSRNLLVQPDEILAIQALADDGELPIQRLELYLRINNGRWEKVVLANSEVTEGLQPKNSEFTSVTPTTKEEAPLKKLGKHAVTLNHTLDLLNYTLNPGDRVKLKVVAYDLKKQPTDTQPIELTILSRSFETSRIETVAAQSRIQKELDKLLTSLNKVADDANNHNKLLKTLNPQDPQSSIQWAAFADLTKVVHEDTLHAVEEITTIARTLPKGSAAREAGYALRTLGRIIHEVNTAPPAFIESARESIDKNKTNQYLDDARNRIHEARGRTGSLNTQFKAITAGTLRAILAEDLHNLVKQQNEILPPDQTIQDDPLFWKRLARREKAAVNQALTIERNLDRLGQVVIGRLGTTYQKSSYELTQARDDLQKALDISEATQPGPELLAPAKAFKEKLVQFLSKAGSNQNSLYSKAFKEHRYLTQQTEDDLHSVYRIIFTGRDLLRNQKDENTNRLNGNARQANINAANSRHFQRLLSQSTWPGAVGRLKSSAAATETRKDADNQFAKDAGVTALALDNLATRFSREYSTQDGDPNKVLQDVEKVVLAFRKLENVHQLVDIQKQIQNIGHSEKWQLRHPSALIHTPYEWSSAIKFVPDVAKKMKESQLNPEAVRILSQLPFRDYTKTFSQHMSDRHKSIQNPMFRPTRKTKELQLILQDIAEVLRLVQPELIEARELIENHSPTIADLAKELAEKTEQLKNETEEQAKDASETQDPETKRADIQKLEEKQEALLADLKDLTNALRQDANTQNLLDDEGRERARDADDSIALLQKPAVEAEQNLQQANLAQRTEDQVRELNETKESQAALQEALEQVAEHYENRDDPEAIAESRQELRAAEEELGIAQELEDKYSEVERLAELQQLDPEQLLAALENELEQNRLMQNQLSNITEDALKETQENLEAAAQQESEIPEDLAKSDKETLQEARNLAQELKKIGQEARKIAREEVNQANQAARKAQVATASDQLEETRRELDSLGQQAEQASRSSTPQDIAETAQDIIEPLKDISENLSEAAKDVAELQQTNAQNAKDKAEQLKNQSEALTQKANEAVEKANELIEQANEAKEAAIEAQQEFIAANDRALDTENGSPKSPESSNADSSPTKPQDSSDPSTSPNQQNQESNPQESDSPDQSNTSNPESNNSDNSSNPSDQESSPTEQNLSLDEAEKKFEQAVAKAQEAQQSAQQAQQQANEIREQANQASREAKAAQNLANQFEKNANKAQEILNQSKQAQQKADTASNKTQELAKKAQEIAEQLAETLAQISPTESALDQANQEQANINDVAEQAADDLARAARHEERLGNEQIAQELQNLSQQAADSLNPQVENASQQLQSLDADNQLSDLAEAAQNIANEEATEARNSAQKADQKQLSQDIGQTAQELSKAAEQAQIASEQSEPSPSNISEAAKALAQELQEAAQEFAQQAQEAQEAAQQIQEPANQAQQNADQAQQAAQTAQQAAQQASEAVQQAQQAQQQAQQAQQTAQQAQQQSQQAQQAAQQAAQNAAQDPATAEQAQAAAQQAQQAAQQAQQTADQAQQAAQQAAQNAQQQAVEAAQTAQQAAQEAQQAEQATPQGAQIASKSAKEAQQAAEAAQQSAQQASEAAQQAAQSASENQSSEAAQQAAQTAQQASEAAQQAAQSAQQAAESAQQAAQEAQQQTAADRKESFQQAQSAAENAQFSAQTAQQAAQLAEAAAQLAANPEASPLQTAQQATQTAQQAAQQANQAAQQAAQQAQTQQAKANPDAKAAQNAAQQAQQAAQQAAELAQAAGNLAEGLEGAAEPGESPFAQPFAEASQALAEQAQNLENFFNEGLAQSATPAQGTPASPSSPPQAPPASASAQTPQGSPSSPAATPPSSSQPSASSQSTPALSANASPSPFTNPEISQALAQTLDAVDQSLASSDAQAASSSESGTPGQPTGTPAEAGSPLADAAASQAAASPTPGTPGTPTPGAPSPGTPSPSAPAPGTPSPGAPSPGTPGAPSPSLAQAMQSLAQAMSAQSAAMSQARNANQMPGQNPVGQGLQLNSGGGAAVTAGNIPYKDLIDMDSIADEDWGNLPKQMAKDLIEGSQEEISGEYSDHVKTYFRAIAELARQNKEE